MGEGHKRIRAERFKILIGPGSQGLPIRRFITALKKPRVCGLGAQRISVQIFRIRFVAALPTEGTVIPVCCCLWVSRHKAAGFLEVTGRRLSFY